MTTDGPGGGLIDRLREFTEQYASEIRSEFESQLARLRAYDDQLTAVMPQDFKDWHENSFAERPEIAAAVIKNLRSRLIESDRQCDVNRNVSAYNEKKAHELRQLLTEVEGILGYTSDSSWDVRRQAREVVSELNDLKKASAEFKKVANELVVAVEKKAENRKSRVQSLQEELDAAKKTIEDLKKNGSPGVLHEVDKAFYNLAIAERNRANDVIRNQQNTINQLKTLKDSSGLSGAMQTAIINASIVAKIDSLLSPMQGESICEVVEKLLDFLKRLSTVCREFIGPTRSPAALAETISKIAEIVAEIERDNHIRFETNVRLEE